MCQAVMDGTIGEDSGSFVDEGTVASTGMAPVFSDVAGTCEYAGTSVAD